MDKLKKAKEFLSNLMDINSYKENIQKILSKYPEEPEDEDLTKPDLEELIENMTNIIASDKKYNRECEEDKQCLETLKCLLQSKT